MYPFVAREFEMAMGCVGLGIRSSDAKNMKPDSDVLSNYAQWIVTNVSEERVALELLKICSQ